MNNHLDYGELIQCVNRDQIRSLGGYLGKVRNKFLLITNSMHFFMYLFIYFISLHVSSIKCPSSGDRILLIHYLIWLVCVSDCLVCRSWPSWLLARICDEIHGQQNMKFSEKNVLMNQKKVNT